jgi:hypothetical protein
VRAVSLLIVTMIGQCRFVGKGLCDSGIEARDKCACAESRFAGLRRSVRLSHDELTGVGGLLQFRFAACDLRD